MTGSLDSQVAHFTSMIEAVGPSPSSAVDELRALEADLEKEIRGPSRDLERRYQELVALKQRDVFEKRVAVGSAATNTNTGADTDANTPTTTTTDGNTTTTDGNATTTDGNTDTNPKAKAGAKTNVDMDTSSNTGSDTDTNAKANTDTNTNSDTDGSNQSATATRSPSVGVLREEQWYLRKRVKVYDELTRRLLRVIDRRQAAADERIRLSEEALVVCNVSHFCNPRFVSVKHVVFLLRNVAMIVVKIQNSCWSLYGVVSAAVRRLLLILV